MEAVLLLANSAEEHDGLVSALGMGWSQTTTPTALMAVIMLIKVPWDQTNRRHSIALELVDADGRTPKDPAGIEVPVLIGAEIEVGRPAGHPVGAPIDSPEVVGIPPLPLRPGTYQWRLEINGDVVAVRSFLVLQA